MARQRKNFSVIDLFGNAAPNPAITVYDSGTVNLSSIYSDDVGAGTALANPFVGDAQGRFFFYADDGQYDVVVVATGVSYTLGAENFIYTPGSPGTGIVNLNGLNGVIQVLDEGTSGADFNIVSAGNTHTFNLPDATSANRGALTAADFTTFSDKLGTLNGLVGSTQTLAAGSAGNDFAISSVGTAHTFNLPTASSTKRGLLASADWTTFNSKQGALPAGDAAKYLRGDVSMQTLNTLAVPELINLYYTDARARAAVSATAPLTYVAGTGVFAIPVATAIANGYLASADFSTFNGKVGSINASSVVAQTFAVGTAGTDFAISTVVGTGVHTFNIPSASSANRGLVTTGAQVFAGVKDFNSHPRELIDGRYIGVDNVFHVRVTTLSVASDNAEKTIHTETWDGPLTANRVWEIEEAGTLQCSGANTITFRLYMGGSEVWNSGAVSPVLTTAVNFYINLKATIRAGGATGVVQCTGHLEVDDSTIILQVINTATSPVDLTGTPIILFTGQLSNSGAADTFTVSSGIWASRG